MGLRFKKSIKLGKGVKLNFGKKSAGVSFGGKNGGVSLNSTIGARVRISAPGTGASYSTKLGGKKKRESSQSLHTTVKRTGKSDTSVERIGYKCNAEPTKKKNPPKPPKSPKVYLYCGIIVAVIGFFMLFLFWPLGLIFVGIGIYYIACGPKIYAGLAEKYKEMHPDFKENK